MIIVADSGSTKTDWALLNPVDGTFTTFNTVGYNPYFIDEVGIVQSLTETLLPQLNASSITQVHFYGAGCGTETKVNVVKNAFSSVFPNAQLHIGHDLLGSARALLGNKAGFAAILGTGANTCLYDGKNCVHNIDSLGYLMGDEGSGSYIGKKLLRDYMRRRMEPMLYQRFKERFELVSNEQILKELYKHPFPNRYLAGFCRFTDEFTTHPYVRNRVRESFNDFFVNLVSKYPNYQQYTFNCVGSVGYVFKDVLTEEAYQFEMQVGKIIQSPIVDLVEYHQTN